jgi:hypothetical protein
MNFASFGSFLPKLEDEITFEAEVRIEQNIWDYIGDHRSSATRLQQNLQYILIRGTC